MDLSVNMRFITLFQAVNTDRKSYKIGSKGRSDEGFSLMEMLIVLVILATLLVLVVPQTFNSATAMEFDQRTKTISQSFERLRADAVLNQRDYVILHEEGSSSGAVITPKELNLLPNSWSSSGDAILIFRNGMCKTSTFTIISDSGRNAVFIIDKINCKVRRR